MGSCLHARCMMNMLKRALLTGSTNPSVGKVWAFVYMETRTFPSFIAITKFSERWTHWCTSFNVVRVGKHARRISASIFQEVEAVRGVFWGCLVRQGAECVVLAFVLVEELLAEGEFMYIMNIGTPKPRAFAWKIVRHQGTEGYDTGFGY